MATLIDSDNEPINPSITCSQSPPHPRPLSSQPSSNHSNINFNFPHSISNTRSLSPQPFLNNPNNISTPPAAYSKRRLITSKAINLSSKIISKSATYLASRDSNDQFAIHSHQTCHAKSKSSSKINDPWKEWDNDVSNWHMKVGGQPAGLNHSNQLDLENSNSNSSSLGYLSYFNRNHWQKRNRDQLVYEDHLVCFPGFVALRSPSYARAGDIDVFLAIHAFKAKPSLDIINRSQRLVYSMICKITGLPPLPSNSSPLNSDFNPEDPVVVEDEDLMSWNEDDDERMDKFEPLLPSQPLNLHGRPSTLPPRSIPPNPSSSSLSKIKTNSSPSLPTRIIRTEPTPIKSSSPAPFKDQSPSRSSSLSSSSSSHLQVSDSEGPSFNQLLNQHISDNPRQPEKMNIGGNDLYQLHWNLKDRLHSFFSQKSEGQKIRLQLYGICSTRASSRVPSSQFRSRVQEADLLTPELTEDEFIINNGRPLLTQIVTTKPGGVWTDKIVLPWQTIETHLRVHHLQQQNLLHDNRAEPDPNTGLVRLKIEAELVREESGASGDATWRPSSERARGLSPDQSRKEQLKRISIGKSSVAIEMDVIPAMTETVHVISDIDDTIKQTNVLGGLKHVFRNVFLSEFDQVAIPGMAEWYQDMQRHGCWMHYISNSPLELWYCIEGFLAATHFPRGSVSLKEYARGATSILSGMWESAGSRKRARVEQIMKQFPSSKFICVGDSGEQDLEMYVGLAQAYPGQILAIYIRDVTTPLWMAPGLGDSQPSKRSMDSMRPDGLARARGTRNGPAPPAEPVSRSPARDRQSAFVHAVAKAEVDGRARSSSDTLAKPKLERQAHVAKSKPVAPPKPLHLSSAKTVDPCRAPESEPAAKSLVGTPSRVREREPGQGGDTKQAERAKKISGASTVMVEEKPAQSLDTRHTERARKISGTSTVMVDRASGIGGGGTPVGLGEDAKTSAMLEAFRMRVHKAEMDLGAIEYGGGSGSQEEGWRGTRRTKLRFFRDGKGCREEALELVRDTVLRRE